MNNHYPATSDELAEIRLSVECAGNKLGRKGTFWDWLAKRAAAQEKSQDYQSQKKALLFRLRCNLPAARAGRAKPAKRIITGAKVLNTEEAKRVLLQAAEQEDWGFITGLGKLLGTKEKIGPVEPRRTSFSSVVESRRSWSSWTRTMAR